MKNQSKKHIRPADIAAVLCLLILSLFLISALPSEDDMAIYDSVIRLHVLANSDSEEDQSLKLKVRDRVLEMYGEQLASYDNVDDASEELAALCDKIESYVDEVLAESGSSYLSHVTLTRESYPTRVYENVSLPAGEYRSLRIIIGEGKGANWWCVLFPPLCLSSAYGENHPSGDSIPVGLTYEQYRLISGSDEPEYILKFKLLELFGSKK